MNTHGPTAPANSRVCARLAPKRMGGPRTHLVARDASSGHADLAAAVRLPSDDPARLLQANGEVKRVVIDGEVRSRGVDYFVSKQIKTVLFAQQRFLWPKEGKTG